MLGYTANRSPWLPQVALGVGQTFDIGVTVVVTVDTAVVVFVEVTVTTAVVEGVTVSVVVCVRVLVTVGTDVTVTSEGLIKVSDDSDERSYTYCNGRCDRDRCRRVVCGV